MSEFITVKTCIRTEHLDCLVKALQDVEPVWTGNIEVSEKPVNLYGFHGDRRKDVAHLVIRRKYIGSNSNDIGFLCKADGTVEAIISQYDQKRYSQAWMLTVAQHYAYRVAEKQAVKLGATISKTLNEDGTWRVVLKKPEVKAWQSTGRAW